MKVAEQRKHAVHKARPVPKYAKLEVKTSTLIFLFVSLFFEGGGQPEEAHHCHLPLFVDQEERQGVKILRLCLKFLATFSVYCKIASGRIHCVFCTNNQHY